MCFYVSLGVCVRAHARSIVHVRMNLYQYAVYYCLQNIPFFRAEKLLYVFHIF